MGNNKNRSLAGFGQVAANVNKDKKSDTNKNVNDDTNKDNNKNVSEDTNKDVNNNINVEENKNANENNNANLEGLSADQVVIDDPFAALLGDSKPFSKTHVMKGIYFEKDVAKAIDKLAGNKKGLKSQLVNEAVKQIFKEKGWMQ